MIKIGMAAKDERGKYSGGIPGDQTRQEVYIRSWYNRPWDRVIRLNDPERAERLAAATEAICNNEYVGYSQSTRLTLWEQAALHGWRCEEIDTPCNCDCSSLVAVAARAAGLQIPKDIWTGNLETAFMRTGGVTVLRDSMYRNSDVYLRRGDILLNTLHHVAVALGNGSKVETVKPIAARIDTSKYPEIARGASGVYVVLLQQALSARGYKLDQDGIFGPDTDRKVRAFQRDQMLIVDGIVGPKTWYTLFNG